MKSQSINSSSVINTRTVISRLLESITKNKSASFPLSTSDGTLVKINKSSLLHAIEAQVGLCCANDISAKSTLIIDGMALIQALHYIPSTFGELANVIFDQVIKLALKYECSRVDFVTDRYPVNSITNLERSRRAAVRTQIFHIQFIW